MRIGIVSSTVAHVNGGYRLFVDQLEPYLVEAGHRVERIYLPFSGQADSMFAEATAYRMLDLSASCDRIVCCRPPAHMLKHPCKVVWFIHHERMFYDLWDTRYNTLPKNDYWSAFRSQLIASDTVALKEARYLFSNSEVVAQRLRKFNGLTAEVLYPPLAQPERFESRDHNSELLFVCRIEHHKRQHLAIEAMAATKTPVRLRIAGATQDSHYLESLHRIIRKYNLEDRVTIMSGWISEGEKSHLLSHALAVVYIPFDEDSYGYPTLEGAHSCRPIITASDAGGVCEFVVDGVNGIVAEPEPQALADAFDSLWADRSKVRRMGTSALDRLVALNINWQNVVARLTA